MEDQEVIEKALARKKKKHVIPAKDFLSSGSTLLNLAATGRTKCCYAKGHYYWFVGDSESGKTWLALVALAEASINPEFDDYRLIYDNSEHGALMNIERYFGKRVADRLEPPRGTREDPEYSRTVEDMYDSLSYLFEDGRPFIFIEDSMDVLETRADIAKQKKQRSAREKGVKEKGTYGTSKASINSSYLRSVVSGCRKTGSIVNIISQTREKIGFGAQYDPLTTAGGRALKFYATLNIWTSIAEKIKRTVKGKKRQLGIMCKVRIKKNRVQGKDRTIMVPIYHSSGVDDVGSCIDYLIDEKYWKGTEETVKAPDFEYSGSKDGLIEKIEEEDLESDLRTLVMERWNEIEEACKVQRKNRYA